jgi:DNA polymerase III delta prime subunit
VDDRAREFVDVFQRFMEEVVNTQRRAAAQDGSALVPALRAHLGVDPRILPVVTEEIAPHLFVDLDVALEAVQADSDAGQVLGLGGGQQRRHHSLSELLDMAGRFGQFPLGAVDYARIATGPDTTREAVSFGLRLFTFDGVPVAVLQRAADIRSGSPAASVEVLTPGSGTAARLIDAVRRLMTQRSVLRRQVLSLGGSAFQPGIGGIVFHRRPVLDADDIVLPDGVLDRIRRHVAGVAQHRDRLRASGQHLKRGLLLHGPPGTGKTHTVRFLIGDLPELTVILLAGPSIQFVSEAAQLARAMQPALVVLEDCDLVAERRDHHTGDQPLLFAVLEALDGLDDDADVAFLLTTNRAGILEPALAQRPGRIDLAVEVPLPDEQGRRRLLELYGRDLPISPAALDQAAARTNGTTASFAKELIRRTVLIAAEADRETDLDPDLDTALEEMLSESQALTRTLLGSPDPATEPGTAGRPAHN